MELLNEIKKALYKDRPIAVLQEISKQALQYKTAVIYDKKMYVVNIEVPLNEIDAVSVFKLREEGQLLRRYVKSYYELDAKF